MRLLNEAQCTTVCEVMDINFAKPEDITYAAKKWVNTLVSELQYATWRIGVVTRAPQSHRSRKRGEQHPSWRLLILGANGEVGTSQDGKYSREVEFFYKVLPFLINKQVTNFGSICAAYDVSLHQPFCIVAKETLYCGDSTTMCPIVPKPFRLAADSAIVFHSSKRLMRDTTRHGNSIYETNRRDDTDILL